eukprot:20316-Heterococcus_DN1.PRE.1
MSQELVLTASTRAATDLQHAEQQARKPYTVVHSGTGKLCMRGSAETRPIAAYVCSYRQRACVQVLEHTTSSRVLMMLLCVQVPACDVVQALQHTSNIPIEYSVALLQYADAAAASSCTVSSSRWIKVHCVALDSCVIDNRVQLIATRCQCALLLRPQSADGLNAAAATVLL